MNDMSRRPLALITGASRGIGAAVARALGHSHELLLGGRDGDALRELAEELPAAMPWVVDLADGAAVAAATRDIEALDVLVHSAGIVELGAIADAGAEVCRRHFEVNVIAVAELTRLVLPALRAARGHVVVINSGSGRSANPGRGPYAASKFAVRAFADVLRAEEPELRVTTVYPGQTATDMQRGMRAAEGREFEPNKYLRPESVATAVHNAITTTDDAHPTELILRPRAH
ncbi:short chain dehydrogenase [Actinokineospora globicatena]|uniref:Short chain dehydrogenase n=2 Tax=Actinokineospora globicatena TaxID=103729 RepID=A0A9W6V603_9PSEU|nr:short chain dehydrogenase [Actinokineospora globicatena]